VKQLDVAIVLIENQNSYLLQYRDESTVGGRGKIGCFGGKIAQDESPQQAAAREVNEETDLKISTKDIKHLADFSVTSDWQNMDVLVRVKAYWHMTDKQVFTAREGKLVKIDKKIIYQRLDELTPATRQLFSELKEN
jgi:ADP-ribose pyrophosphatase YjhB (NUDIX family)